MHKREFPLHYARGKKLFHIVVHMSDEPGSMTSVMDELGKTVNMIGTSSYTLGDGTAMLSSFAESLSPEETVGGLKKSLTGLKAVLDADVRAGEDGLLVDTFHTGISVGGEDYLLLRREGLAGVFDHIVKIFGTGGEVLLYEEGKALGRDNAQKSMEQLGEERVVASARYLGRALTAQGWGKVDSDAEPKPEGVDVAVEDCFECSGGTKVRKGCDFMRGFLEGGVQVTRGVEGRVEETSCILRGDARCVFRIRVS